MNDFIHSCNAAATYPKNLISPSDYQHTLQRYVNDLDEREARLFGVEDRATVNFVDLDDGATNFKNTCIGPQGLRGYLQFPPLAPRIDPTCRYIFIHAPSSRAKLKITRKMLLELMSYHQMMPSFLDFLFSFGTTHHAKDFYYIGFRHDTTLGKPDKRVAISTLGRSGQCLQLCYSLRSVESSPQQEKWPWSIRGIATHHAFDFETGRMSWVIVKGEGGVSIKDRIIAEASSSNGNMLIENWRWYINFIEQEVQAITRKTLSMTVVQPQAGNKPQLLFRTASGFLKTTTTPKSYFAKTKSNPPKLVAASSTSGPPPPPPLLSASPGTVRLDSFGSDSEFSFEDLQRIEYIEEHANDALLVIKLNSSVLSALVRHYTSIMESMSCPHVFKRECAVNFRQFVSRISDISIENETQQARLETLLRLLADRKGLSNGILEYQNIEASKDLAGKAQYSADRVEYMTQQMKEEAVFMRIITLVTLFFLPGTFISTIMSTDIIRWQEPDPEGLVKVVSWGAVKFYLFITVPCMLFTFAIACGYYQWSKWREQKESDRQAAELMEP